MPVTVDEVVNSPPIAEPIHLLDCCVISDWGSAVLLERPEKGVAGGVDVIGFGQGHEGYAITSARDLTRFPGIVSSGRTAFEMADLTPDDVDVALIYDSFTITLLVALENLGFCHVGDGGKFVGDGRISPQGEMPVNPHGGQLSYSGGHGHFLTEAVRQLRGTAPSAQVKGAEVALCQGTAAVVLSSYTVLLARQR